MIRSTYLLILLYLCLSCSNDKNKIVYTLLKENNVVLKNTEKEYIFLVSEINCVECSEKLLYKIKNEKKTGSYEGIYFRDTIHTGFLKISKNTNSFIKWNTTNDNSIFVWAALQSNSKYGPYLLEFQKGIFLRLRVF